MKKILGLDLGVTSIGWCLVEDNGQEKKIVRMGSRIIPLSTDDKDEFSQGNSISKNQKRTLKRTQRKGYDRYQLRRSTLKEHLAEAGMLPDDHLIKLHSLDLWGLRSRAVSEKVELQELGRLFLHLNQKRGYRSSRSDATLEKKDTDYVAEVKNRYQELKNNKFTIGQFFFNELQKNQHYRIKQQVYPREAYIDEFDSICEQQKKYWPDILTTHFIDILRNEIIYYQRKLKSQKGLVSICEFEGFYVEKKEAGKEKTCFVGPRVAPRSSPLFQTAKVWESINSIALKNKRNTIFNISVEQKKELFDYLDCNDKLSETELFKILGIKKSDGWYGNKQTSKGLQGNLTKAALLKFLDKGSPLLEFPLNIENTSRVNRETGEVLQQKVISSNIERSSLYQLWHTIYSIADENECAQALVKNFNIGYDVAIKLAGIDFTNSAFGNKSVKAIRKTLPYLIDGHVYSSAAELAGYNHSDSLTKKDNLSRKLFDRIPNLKKNSIRQPVVEKILNHLINLVNALLHENQGIISRQERERNQFEIRIELARELKQSKEERNETFSTQNKREKENNTIKNRIENDYKLLGVRATRNNIIKWRLFHEISNDESKLNAICIYCGQPFGITDALRGSSIDVEHIIPKSLLFDDSQSNKTLTHRRCNEDKNNRTAFDFMSSKGEATLNEYIERVDALYKNRVIGKVKRDKLLMPVDKIPQDFIDRQLGETRYITRKAREILSQVCYNVWSTSGSVTAYLRNKWGWEDVTMNLQMSKYRELGLTEWKAWETNDGQSHKRESIKDWSKRDDHRHHAIDALTVACTQQSFIQRLNTLSSSTTREEMFKEIGDYKNKLSLLDNFIVAQRPFTTQQVEKAVENIIVSFKSGKKVASIGKRKIKKEGKKVVVQTGIVVPRGPLSEESVYGKIRTIEKGKSVKYLFENPHLIFKPYIKELVQERLVRYEGDSKKALASLKKEPIFLNAEKTKELKYGTCFKNEIVIKYPVTSIKEKDLPYIVDEKVRKIIKERLQKFHNKEREAFKDLENNPVWFNEEHKIPIKTVRIATGLSSVEAVKKDENGKDIGYVKPGNNHHLAFYLDKEGKKHEHACSFWHGVERKKYNLPVVINNPRKVWDSILTDKDKYPETFLKKLPFDNWTYIESLQQNEMFIMGLNRAEFEEAFKFKNYAVISKHLYRVQKLSMKGNGQIDIWFRHHLETELNDSNEAKAAKRFYNIQSIGAFEKLMPIKVRVNNLGEISFDFGKLNV